LAAFWPRFRFVIAPFSLFWLAPQGREWLHRLVNSQPPPASARTLALELELAMLPDALKAHLARFGFDGARLAKLARTLREVPDTETRRRTRNRVQGSVRAPAATDIHELATGQLESLRARGQAAIASGELAFVVMAGGMATRMGGIVKALAEVIPGGASNASYTFLDLRLREQAALAKVGPVPLWLMTSDATDAAIAGALAERKSAAPIARFPQNLSLRVDLTGALFRQADGTPSPYATGHGDLPDALRRSGLLRAFRAAGGKYVWIANIDNLGATVDPAILGWFIESQAPLAVEVCPKEKGDRGGIPVFVEAQDASGARMEVLEEFRLPDGFDPTTVQVFNTNTFLLRADALEETPFTWTYFEVEKKVDGHPAVQFERLLQEMTHHLPATYLRVSRDREHSRFLPVKDFAELEQRRPDIERVLAARGILG
jgi:UTP--glucose-1-phosphate uridylyltransferase